MRPVNGCLVNNGRLVLATAAALSLFSPGAFAGATTQLNLPPECKSPDSKCGCHADGDTGDGVADECIKVHVGLGRTTPWTGSMSCSLKVFADNDSPAIFTADSLYAVLGGYTFKRLGQRNMSDGATPAEVVLAHGNGEPVSFVFSDGESVARPNPGVHIRMDERLMMVDAEGWAVTSNPVYYDLYVGDGTRRRFLATNATGALGRLVSATDARGVTVTPADMGVDVVYDSNGVRQFLTPSRLADVVQHAGFTGYDVRVYSVAEPPARNAATGLYAIPDAAPVKTLTVRRGNGDRRAVVTVVRGGGEPREYAFDYAMGDWSLTRPSGVEERKERYIDDERAAQVVKEVRSTAQTRMSRTEHNYKWESWGFAMTNRVDGFGGVTDTTEWTYHTSGNGRGQVKTERRQSGLLIQYAYDNADRVVSETRSGPGMMTEATTYSYTPVDPGDPVLPVDTRPRTVVKTLDGVECERTYYVYSPLTNIVERVGTQGAPYGGTNALRTVTAFYSVTGGPRLSRPNDGLVQSVRHEDGRLDLYDYALVSNLWTETVTHLHEQSPSPVSGKTTRDVTLTNARGEVAETRTEAYIDGAWHIIARERRTYNAEGKVVRRENLAGQVTTTEWDCCHKISETQPDGSTTTWDYDDEGRMIASSRLIPLDMTNVTWLTTCYEYDDLNRQIATWQTNYAAQVGLPVERTTYDAIGRVVSRIDTLGNTTTTTCSPDGRTVSVQSPNTSTRITTRSPNGNLLSVTGSAVMPEFHTYGILPDGTRWSHTVQGETPSSPRFTKPYENLLGQTVREERSGFKGAVLSTTHTYDSLGRLVRTSPDYEPTVEYSYDVLGNRIATTRLVGRAVPSAPQGGPASVPAETEWRRSEVRSLFIMQDGAIWLVQSNIVSCSDATITSLVTSSSRQLTGLTAALPSRSRTTDVRGNSTENEMLVDLAIVTSRQTVPYATNKPLSLSRYGVSLMDVSVSAVTNTVAYDSLGRPIAHTDGRGNTSRTEYNAIGQRTASIDALGNRTTYAYDQFGNLAAVTNPLGNAIVYEYDLRGRKTYEGGATYPVRYTYDVFGNKATMMTCRNESLGPDSGDVTIWLYDEASNCMTNKVYADGKGPRYSYTPDGRLSRRTWARGIETDYAYDGWGNLTNTVYSDDTPPLAYSYADSGKLASAIFSDGTFYAYGYDAWLLNTNESVHVDSSDFGIERSHDEFRRAQETAVVVTNVQHSAKVRLYDSEDRVCGYVLTNAAGRGVSVSLDYDGSYVTNTVYTLPNGSSFSARLSREAGRRNLITRRDYFFGGQSIYWYSTEYDLLNRPTNATDSVSLVREWLYNRRSELSAATVGTDRYGYAYDSIGNRLWSAANAVTISYTANSLNQYTAVSAGANPVYDADGNMTGDGTFAYAYDAENRLVSVTSAAETNGAIRVLNAYDHRNRRIRKTVQRLNSSIAPPPSPPVGIHEWETQETHTFVWDGNNIVLEKVEFANGTTRTFEYFWGADKSGTEQGAGGVEGLLAVSVDGVFYIPCYDHNGNIILYVSEAGSIAAQYTYDPYGNIVDSSGNLADVFSFGFSTQYHDRETGMVGYKRRFYRPDLGRWLNRDPITERGGANLYCFVRNGSSFLYDYFGLSFGIVGPNTGTVVELYDGRSEPYVSDLWFAVYGDSSFNLRRYMKISGCDCSSKEPVRDEFNYFSIPRGKMYFGQGKLNGSDEWVEQPAQYREMYYAELISRSSTSLTGIKGTVEVRVQLTHSDVRPSDVVPNPSKDEEGFGTENRYPYGDRSREHPITNFKIPDGSGWQPKGIIAEISFTLVLDCDEGIRLKSLPKKTGDWSLDGQNWHRAFGEGLAPRASGTAIELLP